MNNHPDDPAASDPTPQAESTEALTPQDAPPSPSVSDSSAMESDARASAWTAWFRAGLRASVLRPIRAPDGPSMNQMVVIVGFCLLLGIAVTRVQIAGPASFSFRNWLYGWATTGLMFAGAWLVQNERGSKPTHASPVAAWYLLACIASIPINLLTTAYSYAYSNGLLADKKNLVWAQWLIFSVVVIWYAGATWRIGAAINSSKRVTALLTGWTVVVMLMGASVLNAIPWKLEYIDDGDGDDDDAPSLTLSQEVFETQQALLTKALSTIETRKSGGPQIYAVIFAPYSQDVFLRESKMVQELLEERFGAKEHTIRLVNHPSTTKTVPWATNLNLERTLASIAAAMDKDKDVLVIYLTSHGGSDFKLSAFHYPLEVEDLTGERLGLLLEEAGIKNRVIAVSACYSGGWVDPLKGDSTLIMTAADKDHTSFGCGSKSELTYFGRALFDEQLRKTYSFEEAFKAAVPVIESREKEAGKDDGFSNPQISVGAGIKKILDKWASDQAAPAAAPTSR